MGWVPMSKGPLASKWQFRGEKNGWKYWASQNGVLYRVDAGGHWEKYRADVAALKGTP